MTLIESLLLLSTCACIFGWGCARMETKAIRSQRDRALDLLERLTKTEE